MGKYLHFRLEIDTLGGISLFWDLVWVSLCIFEELIVGGFSSVGLTGFTVSSPLTTLAMAQL